MDTSLKQRLIGAIVLVALAVIFLPMLVKGPAPDSGVRDVPLTAPEAPAGGQFETRELPLVTPAGAASGGATGMPAGVQPLQDNPDAADLAGNDDGQALPPATAAGNYAVNFGAYASEADADAVIAYLKKSQLPGFSQADTINGRTAWRVRIGPYADRAQAESVRLQATKLRSDVNAQVVTLDADAAAPPVRSEPLPPEPARPVAATTPKPEPAKPAPARPEPPKAEPKPAPATTKPAVAAPAAPAASNVGFAVQLGAFSQAADANALRDKARAAGFSAFVEQVRTDKGTLSRVRVGPVANRAEAEQLKAQVAAKVGIAGMVRPHP
ncbi:SPOR domain-containing protein [Flavobacterium sp. MXW15]|uniref:SPOR domain-containing protein n=1 Tax=Xanthomonas chitinilytica TaxID=2989819 RepID=A0ABT3JU91_9XANT|nr:SPOR domain-containing protein [Xanthomonas sp. H13-6]MCW4453591.1 SPOR domain-containing protein [Flavobacterium sp. MXW15]MCW4472056.1 SPOR domain-containing protein [Xanthomonas sp. H13-6]